MKRYKYMQRREQKQQICLIDFAGLHLIFIKENLMEGVGQDKKAYICLPITKYR